MVTLNKELLEEYKAIFKKEYGKELTDEEAFEGASNLLGFAEVVYDIAEREAIRTKRLKQEPKGFHLEEGLGPFNCLICWESIMGEQGWWDKNGMKCMNCQRAVWKGVVPKSVCKDRNSWYARWQLKNKFGIHPSSIKKLIREGKLKPRNITHENGELHYQIFLINENPLLSGRS